MRRQAARRDAIRQAAPSTLDLLGWHRKRKDGRTVASLMASRG
jgi:hypothetical protein